MCHTLVIEALLGAGADPFLENAAGRTAMDLALKLSASSTTVGKRGNSHGLAVLRRLEKEALFVGHIKLHVSLGFWDLGKASVFADGLTS